MVAFDFICNMNSPINLNDKNKDFIETISGTDFHNAITLPTAMIYQDTKNQDQISANLTQYDFKIVNPFDLEELKTRYTIIDRTIKWFVNFENKPVFSIKYIDTHKLGEESTFERLKRKASFAYDNASLTDIESVGFRFLVKGEDGSVINEYRVEPWIKNPTHLYIEALYNYTNIHSITDLNISHIIESSYTSFADKASYFYNNI